MIYKPMQVIRQRRVILPIVMCLVLAANVSAPVAIALPYLEHATEYVALAFIGLILWGVTLYTGVYVGIRYQRQNHSSEAVYNANTEPIEPVKATT